MVWKCCDGEDEEEIGCNQGWHSNDPKDKVPGVVYDYYY
jgi:hypothetical protein